MSLQNYDLDEAAQLLRCKKRFLEDNLQRLPRQRFGRSVAFSDEDLAEIKRMFHVQPEPAAVQTEARAEVPQLATIRPKRRRVS